MVNYEPSFAVLIVEPNVRHLDAVYELEHNWYSGVVYGRSHVTSMTLG